MYAIQICYKIPPVSKFVGLRPPLHSGGRQKLRQLLAVSGLPLVAVKSRDKKLLQEVRCSFYDFSKPIRFCSNLVETFFNPFLIRKCKKKLGVTMLVFKMAHIKVPLITRTFSLRFFLLTLLVEGNELLSVLKHLDKHYHCASNDFESCSALAIVLQVKIANTIFGCLGHNGHT